MSKQRVLVFGGKGALGSACVKCFKDKSWWVGSVDSSTSVGADTDIIVDFSRDFIKQSEQIHDELKNVLEGNQLDTILCMAGGWAGGNIASEANVAAKHLKDGGLLVLCGAAAACEATPSMIGYGMVKAAVHHLVKSLGAPKSGMPSNSTAVAVLPAVLDTPMNRKWMPKADTSKWTPLTFLASLFYKWSLNDDRPASGSLVKLHTEKGETTLEIQ